MFLFWTSIIFGGSPIVGDEIITDTGLVITTDLDIPILAE